MPNKPPVGDADVEWVIEKSGTGPAAGVGRMELARAVAVWKEAAKNVVAEPEPPAKSAMCVLL